MARNSTGRQQEAQWKLMLQGSPVRAAALWAVGSDAAHHVRWLPEISGERAMNPSSSSPKPSYLSLQALQPTHGQYIAVRLYAACVASYIHAAAPATAVRGAAAPSLKHGECHPVRSNLNALNPGH